MITRDEVDKYLTEVKTAVEKGRYTVSPREKNEILFQQFLFSEDTQKKILLSLCVEDFSEAVKNDHERFAHETLYIFGKDVQLLPRYGGDEITVSLYIKFNKLENQYCIVVSFHEQERELKYAFK